jgi:apolipoprotein N-acyltransferase
MRPALIVAAVAVGVAIVVVAVIGGQARVKDRNKQANVSMARFEQNLKRTAQTSPSDYQQVVAVVDKVEKKEKLSPPELVVWRKAMGDVDAQSWGVNKILDHWTEIRSRSAPAGAVEGLRGAT